MGLLPDDLADELEIRLRVKRDMSTAALMARIDRRELGRWIEVNRIVLSIPLVEQTRSRVTTVDGVPVVAVAVDELIEPLDGYSPLTELFPD